MGILRNIALVLVIIGGLNWGLVGFFEFNLVAELFGAGSALTRVVYVLVGLSAVYMLIDMALAVSREAPKEKIRVQINSTE